MLERIATGVVSLGADGRIETINGAALRLLEVDRAVIGVRRRGLRARRSAAARDAAAQARRGGSAPAVQEIALLRDGREVHLAAAATQLLRDDGSAGGAVLVFDDVTPLIRTQRVAAWRDVARRLAHEIKNPLTPIQLCAERMRRQFSSAPAPARALVEECTSTIVGEVESLKALVDEFAQFARMPAPRAVPADLNAALDETLALYNGLFRQIRIERRFARGLPPVRVDLEQMRRVIINLVDNAVEALGGSAAPAERRAPASSSRRGTMPATASRGSLSPTTARGFRPPIATSSSCRTTRPRPRQRPRAGHRPAHHRRARRQHRGRRQCAARHGFHD